MATNPNDPLRRPIDRTRGNIPTREGTHEDFRSVEDLTSRWQDFEARSREYERRNGRLPSNYNQIRQRFEEYLTRAFPGHRLDGSTIPDNTEDTFVNNMYRAADQVQVDLGLMDSEEYMRRHPDLSNRLLPQELGRHQRSFTERMGDAYDRATSEAGTGEIGAISRWLGDVVPNVENFGLTEEQSDAARIQRVRERRAQWEAIDEQDPAFREDGSLLGNIGRFAAEVVGDTAGNANPTYLLGIGRTALQRIGSQMAIGGSLDAAIQGSEIAQGVRDEYNPLQTATQVAAAAGLQGLGELAAKGVRQLDSGRAAEVSPEEVPAIEQATTELANQVPDDIALRTGEIVQRVADEYGIPAERIETALGERDFIARVRTELEKDGLDQALVGNEVSPLPEVPTPEVPVRAEAPTVEEVSRSDRVNKAIADIDELVSRHQDHPEYQMFTQRGENYDPYRGKARLVERFWDELPEDTRDFLGRQEALDWETGQTHFGAERVSGTHIFNLEEEAFQASGKGEVFTPDVELPARERRAQLAEGLGYSPEEFDALPGAGTLNSTELERGVQLVDQANERITTLLDKAEAGEITEAELTELISEISTFNMVNRRLTAGISEGARILDVAAARDKSPKNLARLLERGPIQTAEDARALAANLRAMNNSPEARRRVLNAVTDPRAEDYVLSVWYNALLSHPATHITNMLGNASHFGLEGFNKAFAGILGQTKRGSDRIYGREIAANLYGVLRSFLDTHTYTMKLRAPFSSTAVETQVTAPRFIGDPTAAFFRRGEDGGKSAQAILPGYVSAIETPSRMLNAADEFWQNMARMSSQYGRAARIAAREGHGYGQAFYKRVGELMDNLTADRASLSKKDREIRDRMLEDSQETADFLVFRDDPSIVGRNIERMRQRRAKEGPLARIGKTTSRLFVPFVQTPDRLAAAVIRNSPLGVVHGRALMRGGPEGHRVMARIMTGTALTAYLAHLAANGMLSGGPNANYDKAQEQASGGFQPYSVKVGDQWVSIRGLDPFATNAFIVSDLVNKYERGDITDVEYNKGITEVISDIAHNLGEVTGSVGSGLSSSTYTENIGNFLQMFEPGYRGDQAVNSLIPNVAQTLTTPAIVRGINNELDPAVRDTTGDGSLGDRIVGRVMSGIPGLSDNLPQRHDVYGRPMVRPDTVGGMLTRMSESIPEEDPTVIELQRLSETLGPSALISPVARNDLRNFKATAEDVQNYQFLSGQYILESVRELQMSGEWDQMSDSDRIKEVRAIARDMRELAREELFPGYYGDAANPAANVDPEAEEISDAEFVGAPPTTFENSIAQSVLEDLGLTITDSGIRATEDQERYFNEAGGRGVAAPGTSLHEYGNAIDVAPSDNVSVDEIIDTLEEAGFIGVRVITQEHGTGPHWHIEWEGVTE